ncbi:TrmH family, group 2 RNA methyltransferase [Candidatus Kinetoplastibacterium blastocrithidii TCC012E]|uniref:tRNA (cytidine(34)-2'-O)-methyltransferase n=1 Tax=Candidatus Kinetoplastidibacterium blastocrithidiae TCC012E TaxID=1208922 RepID=M1LC85_9PROT|nr:tRNA (cytidine(34)-2'-O)-methyltransferase [Candidatus Kinetoplastibacterium blastocrithidii]AFZ83244.1 tRNA (cytidine/uridine-2'-O-)-methyltransferase [Candidatus Kinetoplastibacterium blastocrithidii (ex Strigomonas culicis)]AGF50058.1 TrmH family, group 2 RNA methyltransferase [Candidatus Kinetoplastibacterium blastocrithidii TCC012E]
MFNVILVCPEIPSNTGNAIRLCANTGSFLHIVKPMSFDLDDAKLKRAGLDYHEWQPICTHDSLIEAIDFIGTPINRCFVLTTKSSNIFSEIKFFPGDVFIFGRETSGLSDENMNIFAEYQRLCLPMLANQRSLNLSNAIAVTVYEAWRQNNFNLSKLV